MDTRFRGYDIVGSDAPQGFRNLRGKLLGNKNCAWFYVGLIAQLSALVVCAQSTPQPDYPSKPICFIIPSAAGGPVDVLGRGIGQQFTPAMGQQVVLDNRPGAGTIIALDLVAKAPPDGYVVLLGSGAFTTLASFNKTLPFDPLRDFTPVTQNARIPGFLLVVHPSVPARTVKELIALSKGNPDKLDFTWYGFWLPAGVPAAYANKLHAETVKAVAAPDLRKRFDELGFEGIASDKPADFAKFAQEDMAAVKKLAAKIGFVPQ
jgi:tripartite-type tricarboxylate transporter receptor subunit TctC